LCAKSIFRTFLHTYSHAVQINERSDVQSAGVDLITGVSGMKSAGEDFIPRLPGIISSLDDLTTEKYFIIIIE